MSLASDDTKFKAKLPRLLCDKCGYRYYLNSKNEVKPQEPDPPLIPPITGSASDFIDDPDELLFSVCMRKLNMEDPDVRWGTLLVKVREIINKSKLQRQSALLNKPTDKLLRMIKKSSGKRLVPESLPIDSSLVE
jgi:hypothetical protein